MPHNSFPSSHSADSRPRWDIMPPAPRLRRADPPTRASFRAPIAHTPSESSPSDSRRHRLTLDASASSGPSPLVDCCSSAQCLSPKRTASTSPSSLVEELAFVPRVGDGSRSGGSTTTSRTHTWRARIRASTRTCFTRVTSGAPASHVDHRAGVASVPVPLALQQTISRIFAEKSAERRGAASRIRAAPRVLRVDPR